MSWEQNDQGNSHEDAPITEGIPRWVGFVAVILAGIAVLALGIAWSATSHAKNAEQALAAQGKTVEQNQQNVADLSQRLSQQEQNDADLRAQLLAVTNRLKITQGELGAARRQESQARAQYSKQLNDVQTQLQSKASADDLQALGGDVNGVKSDLEAEKNNLQMARGEFGTLIAKNHNDIEELRRLGERDYYEFTLTGKGKRAKVGGLTVELRDANPKKNQFSVALYVDDMRLDKKNRAVDEPIYFYTSGMHVPDEFVINQVQKDKLVGYLSVPKSQVSASAADTAK